MPALENIRRNIKNLLDARGMTPSGLAKEIGMANALIYGYLSGKNDPGFEQVERIASGLGTTVAALIGEQMPKPIPTVKPEERLRLEGIQLLLCLDGDELGLALKRLREIAAPAGPAAPKKSKPSAG